MLTLSCRDGVELDVERRDVCRWLPKLGAMLAAYDDDTNPTTLTVPYNAATVQLALATKSMGPGQSAELLMDVLNLAHFADSAELHDRVVYKIRELGYDSSHTQLLLRQFRHLPHELRERITAAWLAPTGVPASDITLAISYVPSQMRGALASIAARHGMVRVHFRHANTACSIKALARAQYKGGVHAPQGFGSRSSALTALVNITSLSAADGQVQAEALDAAHALTALTGIDLSPGRRVYRTTTLLPPTGVIQMLSYMPGAPTARPNSCNGKLCQNEHLLPRCITHIWLASLASR